MKTEKRKIENQLLGTATRQLYAVVAKIDKPQEIAEFLRDLLTFEEIDEAARRWQVARLLSKNVTFREISDKTQMSSATIARVNYWLHHGTGGYRRVLSQLSVRKT